MTSWRAELVERVRAEAHEAICIARARWTAGAKADDELIGSYRGLPSIAHEADIVTKAALSIAIPAILERAAEVAEEHATCGCNGAHGACMVDDRANGIATAIRSLKDNPDVEA